MDLHLGEEGFGGNEKVRTIGEDRTGEGQSEAVTEAGGDPRTIGGEASNCSKGRLGEGKSAGEVGGRGQVGDEPVPEPPEFRRGVKELAIKSHRRRPAGRGGGPFAQGYASV